MNRSPQARRLRAARVIPIALALAGLGGCGASRSARPSASDGPPPAGVFGGAEAAAPLPPLPISQTGATGAPDRRIEQIDVVDQDLRLVVRSLAESYGLDYQLGPGITGRVTTRMRDVTLAEALDALVLPHGYGYEIQGRVLRVTQSRQESRIFHLDYMSMARAGVGTTVIQRRLGAAGGTAGAAGDFGGGMFGGAGGDVIQSVSVADLWEEIRISLEGLVFDGAATGATAPDAGAIGGLGAGGAGGAGTLRAPGASSRVGEDGRRLIINPISGTILVSAPSAKLAEVETLLASIEGSVQRQVLIEAKIVEVTLNRRYEFGIDWSVVQQVGSLSLGVGGGESGASFTLAARQGDADREISVVLRALEEQGEVSVLSSPRVHAMNNQRAIMNVTKDEVFFSVTRQPVLGPNGGTIGFTTEVQPQQIAVGITLDVLPQIAFDNTITMNVRPVVTEVVEVREVKLEDGTQASAPVIDRRETDTVVRVRGGETIVIGGLMQSSRRNSEGGVPGLRDIPGIGRLFGGSSQEIEKRELVIFITPRIVASQPPIVQ